MSLENPETRSTRSLREPRFTRNSLGSPPGWPKLPFVPSPKNQSQMSRFLIFHYIIIFIYRFHLFITFIALVKREWFAFVPSDYFKRGIPPCGGNNEINPVIFLTATYAVKRVLNPSTKMDVNPAINYTLICIYERHEPRVQNNAKRCGIIYCKSMCVFDRRLHKLSTSKAYFDSMQYCSF